MVHQIASEKNGRKPGNGAGYLRIVVSKCNPSRGEGYEVAHFIIRGQTLKSLSERDVFLPSLTEAANWVQQNHPDAILERGRNDCTGHLAALCFRCGAADTALSKGKLRQSRADLRGVS